MAFLPDVTAPLTTDLPAPPRSERDRRILLGLAERIDAAERVSRW
jgi:hypothetical protein